MRQGCGGFGARGEGTACAGRPLCAGFPWAADRPSLVRLAGNANRAIASHSLNVNSSRHGRVQGGAVRGPGRGGAVDRDAVPSDAGPGRGGAGQGTSEPWQRPPGHRSRAGRIACSRSTFRVGPAWRATGTRPIPNCTSSTSRAVSACPRRAVTGPSPRKPCVCPPCPPCTPMSSAAVVSWRAGQRWGGGTEGGARLYGPRMAGVWPWVEEGRRQGCP